MQLETRNSEHTTHNSQLGTRNPQLGTHNTQLATRNPQPATRNTQHTTRNSRHTTCNSQLATRNTPQALAAAARLLRAGELVAFPTDTVYGVGAIVWDAAAVGKLYTAKLRSLDKAIPILLADPADLALVAGDLSPAALRLAAHFWPGPLTLVVPKAAAVPDAVTAGGATVAVRIPDHPLARALIRAAGAPLATTSANLSGAASPVTAEEVAAQLAGRVAMILDGGRCPGGVASTVVDVTGAEPVILRPGPISQQQIISILQETERLR